MPQRSPIGDVWAALEDARRGLSGLRRWLLPKAAEDIPLLPSAEHTMLVTLAALVGLYAGIAATFLRVSVRLFGAIFFRPAEVTALLFDPSSPERGRLMDEMLRTNWHPELLGIGGVGVLVFVAYGAYRHLDRWRVGRTKKDPSRAFLIAGMLAAAVGLIFLLHFLVDVAGALTPAHGGLIEVMEKSPWWALLLVALVGGSLVGALAHRFPAARGHGVPDIMEGVALRGGKLRAMDGPIFAGAAGITVAATGSVGLEGPVVYFGATTASGLGQALRLSRSRLRVLAAAGAAAGVAASFNAPIAGALFALEIIIGDFALATFSPVVIASVVGTVVHRSIEGNHPVLGNATFLLENGWEIGLYVLLGLVCGVVGTIFVKVLEGMGDTARLALKPLPAIVRPAVALMFMAGLASLFHRYEVLGSGYDAMQRILEGKMLVTVMGAVLVAKMVATALTLAAGGVGGIMFPSLLIGAATGGLFGTAASTVFGDRVASPSSYAIVGMGAVLTAVQHAPLTATVMVFEFTNDYTIILPLLVSCILATLVATRALGLNLYQRVLRRKGVLLSRGREQNVLRTLLVKEAMKRDFLSLHQSDRLRKVGELVSRSSQTTYPLVDDDGYLKGALRLQDLRPVMFEPGLEDLVVAAELGHTEYPTITPDESLGVALSRFSLQPFEHLIVVDANDSRRAVGLLSLQAAMELYQEGLKRAGVMDATAAGEESPYRTLPPEELGVVKS